VACPRCHASLVIFPEVPTIGQEQEDSIVSQVIDRLSKSGPALDKLVKPVGLRIVKSVHWWIAFPLFWIAVLLGSHFTIKGALESLMISRIDREFREPRIQATMQKVINDKASELLTNEIQPAVERFQNETSSKVQNFQAFLDNMRTDFQKQYQTLSEEVSRLKQRNHLTALGDRAISEADRQALDDLINTANKSEDHNMRLTANAELGRIVSYWVFMSRTQTLPLMATLSDGTVKKDNEIPTNQLLVEVQFNTQWDVRAVSARLLGQRKENGVPEVLLKVALTDANLEVVKYAILSFKSVTGATIWGFFDFDGLKQWWQENSPEVNEKLTEMK
jgi:hypothetical protein